MISIFKSIAELAGATMEVVITIGRALKFSILIGIYGFFVAPVYFIALIVYFISVGLADQIKRGISGENFYPEDEGLKKLEYYLNLGQSEGNRKENNKDNSEELDNLISKANAQENFSVETGRKFFIEYFSKLAIEFYLIGKVRLEYKGNYGEKLVIFFSCDHDNPSFLDYLDVTIFNQVACNNFEKLGIKKIEFMDEMMMTFEEITLYELSKIIEERKQK